MLQVGTVYDTNKKYSPTHYPKEYIMKHVRNLTDQNRKALLELPVGFPVQIRRAPYSGMWIPAYSAWEDGTIKSVSNDYGHLKIVLNWYYASEHVCDPAKTSAAYLCGYSGKCGTPECTELAGFYDYVLDERHELGKSWLDCSGANSIRWSPEALRAFRTLSDDLVLAQTVASLLVGAR